MKRTLYTLNLVSYLGRAGRFKIVKLFEIGCFEIKKFSFLYLIINEMDDNFHLFYLRNVNLFISSHQPATPSFLHQWSCLWCVVRHGHLLYIYLHHEKLARSEGIQRFLKHARMMWIARSEGMNPKVFESCFHDVCMCAWRHRVASGRNQRLTVKISVLVFQHCHNFSWKWLCKFPLRVTMSSVSTK